VKNSFEYRRKVYEELQEPRLIDVCVHLTLTADIVVTICIKFYQQHFFKQKSDRKNFLAANFFALNNFFRAKF